MIEHTTEVQVRWSDVDVSRADALTADAMDARQAMENAFARKSTAERKRASV